MIKLSPSILAADFTRLGEEIKILENENVPYIHVDVMDGHFVPNISMGIPIIESIRKVTDLTLDVHLMLSNPEIYVERFADAGADIINVHKEVCDNIKDIIGRIKAKGKKAAVTVNPSTLADEVLDIAADVDMILVMSVEPGFGAQKFMPDVLDKVRMLREYSNNHGLDLDIEIDGGVNLHNIESILEAGVNVIVAGSSIFGAEDKSAEIKKYYKLFREFENKR